ncbi:hypothetical protein RFI_16744, partial [Reticulomyxa filosa]
NSQETVVDAQALLTNMCEAAKELPLKVQQRLGELAIAMTNQIENNLDGHERKITRLLNDLLFDNDKDIVQEIQANMQLRQFRNLESLTLVSDCVTGFLGDGLLLREIVRMLICQNKSDLRCFRLLGHYSSGALSTTTLEDFEKITATSLSVLINTCVSNLVKNMEASVANDSPFGVFPHLSFGCVCVYVCKPAKVVVNIVPKHICKFYEEYNREKKKFIHVWYTYTIYMYICVSMYNIVILHSIPGMKLYEHVCQLLAASSPNVVELVLGCSFSIKTASTFPFLSTYFPKVQALNVSSLPMVEAWDGREKKMLLAFEKAKWGHMQSIIVDAKHFHSLATAVHEEWAQIKHVRIKGCQSAGFLDSVKLIALSSVENVVIGYRMSSNGVVSITEEQKVFDGIQRDLRTLLTMMPNTRNLKIRVKKTFQYSPAYLTCFQSLNLKSLHNISGVAWDKVFGSKLYNQIESLSIDIDALGFVKYLGQLEEKEIEKSCYWSNALRRRGQRRFSLRSLHLSFPENIDVCRTLIEVRDGIVHNRLFNIQELTLFFHGLDDSQLQPVMSNISTFLARLFSRRNKTVRHFILKFGKVKQTNSPDHLPHIDTLASHEEDVHEHIDDIIFGILTDFKQSGLRFLHLRLPLKDDYTKYLQAVGTVEGFACDISRDCENQQLNILLY